MCFNVASFPLKQNMIHQNESCSAEEIPMSFLTCLLYALEGWSIVEHLNYVVYLLWLFSPLLVAFILPGLVLFILYINIIILHIYKRRTDLKEAYSNDFWDGARQVLATIWVGHARIWNGKSFPKKFSLWKSDLNIVSRSPFVSVKLIRDLCRFSSRKIFSFFSRF